MTQLLGHIQDAAKSLLAAQALSLSVPKDVSGRPIFEAIANHSHAVAGSSSLVHADSLASTARLLETLSESGHRTLERLNHHMVKARALAALCIDGAGQMREYLKLELEGRRAEALAKAEGWQSAHQAEAAALLSEDEDAAANVDAEPGRPVKGGAAAGRREFQLDDEEEAAPPSAGVGLPVQAESIDRELAEIFQREAGEAALALKAQLSLLAQDREDLEAVANVERIFHTLKGAAATVGLAALSEKAAALQGRMEKVLEGELRLSPPVLTEVTAQTQQLLVEAGLVEQAAPAASEQPMTSERRFFVEETLGIVDDAMRLSREMEIAPAPRQTELRGQIGRLFHRLKGAALLLGDAPISAHAANLQRLCDEPDGSPVPAAVKTAAESIRAMLASESSPSQLQSPGSIMEDRPDSLLPSRESVTPVEDQELWQAFGQECGEILEELEKEIFKLEESAEPKKSLASLERLFHTLKGAVNSVGLAPTGKVLHEVEDFLERLGEAPVVPSLKNIANLLFSILVESRRNLKTAPEGYVETTFSSLKGRIDAVMEGKRKLETPASAHRPESQLRESRREDGSAPPSSLTEEAVERRFIKVPLERLDSLMNLAGELVVGRSKLMTRVFALRSLHKELARKRSVLSDKIDAFREQNEAQRLEGGRGRGQSQAPLALASAAKPEVWKGFSDLELDRYEDVHIFSRSLAEIGSDFAEMDQQIAFELTSFNDDADALGGIVSSIQFEVTRSRMVPLEMLFSRLMLPVRDAAAREGRDVRVVTKGEDVNLDKTIADALLQPMLHLVRNAVAHGIERGEERERARKQRGGTLTLEARQESGQIVILVSDDGRGLDLPALHARGVAMGLLPGDTAVDSPVVKDLVFASGLSTAASVSAVSGRGVGCDVVRRAVERLNGSIRVETRAGEGTTFVINLPLTLAITKALVVRQGRRSYAIPLFFAERILDAEEATLVDAMGVRRLRVDGGVLTVHRLERLFGQSDAQRQTDTGPIVLLRMGDQRMALQVDALLGQEEVVVKGLGDVLANHPVFAGVTIRGSGELVLILDVPAVMDATVGTARATPAAAGPQSKALAQAAIDPSGVAAPSASKLRVLFVDDSVSVRKVAESTFRQLNVEITVATDGLDALAKLREGTFDIVFTDLEMPRMHGYELIREIRFLPALRHLPVVVVSSRSGQKHQDQARSLGATDYITKPFSPQDLDGILKRVKRAEGPPPSTSGPASSRSTREPQA